MIRPESAQLLSDIARCCRPATAAMVARMQRLLVSLFAALGALSVAAPAHAIPETGYGERFATEVLPFCLRTWQFGSFTGEHGAEIAYATYRVDAPRGALVIAPGRREPFLRYCELVHDLRDAGYDVFLIDHRGQGWSDRFLADRHRAHVDHFDAFVADLHTFLTGVVQPARYRRVVGLAHSMGGAILTRYAELHPDTFHQLVLSAPMHAIDTKEYPEPLAHALALKATLLGLGDVYAPHEAPPEPAAPLSTSDTTHSGPRWEMRQYIERVFPELTLGGSTLRWLKECLDGTRALRASASALRTPILMFQADEDAYVLRCGQDEVCRRAARCDAVRFPGARHEILMERDAIRDVAVSLLRGVL